RQCRGSKGSKGSTHLFSGESRPMLRVRHLAVMFEQQVFTEIIFKVPPDRVNVVIVVLGIVVFQQEGRSLGAVVMALAMFQSTGPGEIDFVHAGGLDLFQISGSDVRSNSKDVF